LTARGRDAPSRSKPRRLTSVMPELRLLGFID
jgi:hypothetical protein